MQNALAKSDCLSRCQYRWDMVHSHARSYWSTDDVTCLARFCKRSDPEFCSSRARFKDTATFFSTPRNHSCSSFLPTSLKPARSKESRVGVDRGRGIILTQLPLQPLPLPPLCLPPPVFFPFLSLSQVCPSRPRSEDAQNRVVSTIRC